MVYKTYQMFRLSMQDSFSALVLSSSINDKGGERRKSYVTLRISLDEHKNATLRTHFLPH
jgi:hypothetical protein